MASNHIVTFSYKPGDLKAKKEIEWLQNYCRDKHMVFSSQVIKAITNLNAELANNDKPKN